MKTCGIIAEYDPFHTGHARQIAATRQILGDECAIVCVMSGNWTQRGGPALTDKHTRAKLALMSGADLVLELPLPFAISSAEGFARGGVATLHATGIITHLSFGSEAGQITDLEQTAHCLDSTEYHAALHTFLDQGLSFPTARQKAAQTLIGSAADCLSQPNNNLGVEYLRALHQSRCGITPITIPREGAGHGETPRGGYASASHLRSLIATERWEEAAPYLIPGEETLLRATPHADFSRAEQAMLYCLRRMTSDQLALLPDCGEGLSNRLHQAIQQGTSLDSILTFAKTKRYPHARLRRALLWAFLGLRAHDRPEQPAYIRVLGMNQTGRTLLRSMDGHASLPVLTKPAHVKSLSADAQRLFELEAQATDLYGLCLAQLPPCGLEWTRSPIIL